MNNDLLSIPQAATVCSLSRGTIWKYVKSGELKASMTPGGQYRISKSDLEDFMRQKKIYPLARYEPETGRILIVDDEPQFQHLLVAMLAKNGYRTEVACDGFDAGVKVMSFRPNLIILDLFMPGMDGFETCRRIKEDPVTSHVKILAVTGYDTPENMDRIIKMGADSYLAKPFGKNELVKNVEYLLEGKKMS